MRQKLTKEDRTWNATQLTEALEERFGIEVTSEAVR
jgi:transposase